MISRVGFIGPSSGVERAAEGMDLICGLKRC